MQSMSRSGSHARLRFGSWHGPWGFLALMCFLTFVSTSAWAQVTSGSLSGVVTDPTGAVVPGATVVVTDADKGYPYPTTTDAVGRYLLTNLLPGTYNVSVEAKGFKTYKQEGIVIAVSGRVAVDVDRKSVV
jgi:hypothetical protein